MKFELGVYVVLTAILSGCNENNVEPSLKGLQAQEADSNAHFNQEISVLKQRLDSLEWDHMVNEWSKTNKSVSLNIDQKGYIPVETTVGKLLVSVDSLTPYLDGYKIDLQIGNPQSVTFNGVTVSLDWSANLTLSILTNKIEYSKWESSKKTKNEQLPEPLLPGFWNNVEIIVTPATTEEIRNLKISLQAGSLSLGTRNTTH